MEIFFFFLRYQTVLKYYILKKTLNFSFCGITFGGQFVLLYLYILLMMFFGWFLFIYFKFCCCYRVLCICMFVDLFLIFKCDFNLLMSHVSARIIKPFFFEVVVFLFDFNCDLNMSKTIVLYFLGVIWVHFRSSKTKFDIGLKERKFTRSNMVLK